MAVMVKKFLYLFCLFCLGLSSCSNSQNYICLFRFKTIQLNVGGYSFPEDSVFVIGDLAIEKLTSLQDLDVDGTYSRQTVFKGYNLIDFKTRKFKFIKTLENYQPEKEVFTPLSTKPRGIGFDFNFYNGEAITLSDTTIAGEGCKKVAYLIKDGPMKNGKMTILLRKTRSEGLPILFSNLEKAFNGQVIGITFILPDGKTGQQWEIDYLTAKPNPHFAFLKSLKLKT